MRDVVVACALLMVFGLAGIHQVIALEAGGPLPGTRLPAGPMYNFTFTESKKGMGTGGDGGPTDVQLRDLDDDGNLDHIYGGDHTITLGLSILFGDGTGGWAGSTQYGWGYGGSAVGDVNNDGHPDLAVGMHHNYSSSGCGSKIMSICPRYTHLRRGSRA